MKKEWTVTIPKWRNYYVKAKKTNPKYWEWKDKDKMPKTRRPKVKGFMKKGSKKYCVDDAHERFLKNPIKVGKPNLWMVNGQDLYNGILNRFTRCNIANDFHHYFGKYIGEQLLPIPCGDEVGMYLSISCDIYEIKRKHIPDTSNMWPLEKFFEDALQEQGIIPDDSPDYVTESGRKRYHWVKTEGERKLVFTIKYV